MVVISKASYALTKPNVFNFLFLWLKKVSDWKDRIVAFLSTYIKRK